MYEDQTVLTGIKPTGTPHLGNIVGAMQPIVDMSYEADRTYVFIADLHALNAVTDSRLIGKRSNEIAATLLALGLNREKAVLFRQSDIPEVYQLSTLLTNVTPKGLMNRAHAYKAAVEENVANGDDPDAGINMGLFGYPILMAADILLYGSDIVPVGQDQKQHVEMTRDIARKFNHIYGDILTVPKPVIQETASEVPGLDGRKMSKSYDNYIPAFAEPSELRNLVMKIETDSRRPEEPKNPEELVIFQLYRNFGTEDEVESMREEFSRGGLGYGEAKRRLFEAIDRTMSAPRRKYYDILSRPGDIEKLLLAEARKARTVARATLSKVSEAMLGRAVVQS